MSRVFSGELQRLEDIAWKPYALLSRYPPEFKPTCDAVLSMIGSLRLLQKSTEDHQLSGADERKLQSLLRVSANVLSSLQSALGKLPSNEGRSNAVDVVRLDILERTAELSLFLAATRQYSQDALASALGDIRRVNSIDFQNSIETDWGILTSELVKQGCAVNIVDEEYFFIEQWLKDNQFEVLQNSRDISRNATPSVDGNAAIGGVQCLSTDFPSKDNFEGSDGLIVQSPAQMARHSVRRKPIGHSIKSSPSMASSQASRSPYSTFQTTDPGTPRSDFTYDSGLVVRAKPDLDNGLIVRSPSTLDKGLILQSTIQTFDDGLMLQDPMPYKAPVFNFDGLIPATDEFAAYTENAINDEACRLLIEQERNPDSCPRANLWLPSHLQPVYQGADAEFIIPVMDQKSFSVMAYQTAPKITKDVVRLKHLLNASYASGKMGRNDGVVSDAFMCLETVCPPLQRFDFLRSPHQGAENFSDLDVLEFECSTIGITNSPELFPKLEFDLAQESYWKLLSQVMGLLQAITDIFQGRAYITRSRQELEFLWGLHKINSRAAWLQAQLADWDKVENAIRFCRHWHSQQLNLRDQAIRTLQDWKSAQRILMGGEGIDVIELTAISAEDLPKYKISRPSAFAKIRFYKRNIHGHPEMTLEISTRAAPTGRIAIWDKNMKLSISPTARWIDIEIHQNMTSGNEILGHARLSFSFPPGGEATFMNRSLMYGIDENISLKIPCKQNKTGEPVVLNIGLKWLGRYAQVERAGLPSSPPGKMFRTDISGIPTLKETKADASTPSALRPYSSRTPTGTIGAYRRTDGSTGIISAFS